MSTIAVATTAQPANVPPRIKVDITDSGAPAINSVNVMRTVGGVTSPVRTLDGGPLVLTTSGSNRVGTVYDYEMPYGRSVTYSTVEYPAGVSTAASVTSTSVWLVHPGVPGRSMPVEMRVDSFDTEERAANVGVFRPLGRANPIVVTDGRRQGRTGSFTVGTETLAQLATLNALIDDAGVLMLQVPSSIGMGVDPCYVAVLDVRIKRRTNIGTDPYRDVEMPYVVVDAPAGGSQAQWTLADLQATYASLNAIQAAYPTLNAVAFPPA